MRDLTLIILSCRVILSDSLLIRPMLDFEALLLVNSSVFALFCLAVSQKSLNKSYSETIFCVFPGVYGIERVTSFRPYILSGHIILLCSRYKLWIQSLNVCGNVC